MLSSVFGKSFNAGKCKTLLRLAISRIKLLRNKRDMQLKQMRRELGQLLQAKQELTARIRVEHVFREQNIMAAYEIMELFSELLVVRLPIIESQRQCPIDLREAVASLIFAAPRCADLPELQQITSLFAVKYGKDFVAAAAELRPDCGVSRLVIEKLSVRAPSGEVRLKLMKDIAEEQGVDWDAAASEAEYQRAPEDLLDGPNRFMGSSTQFHAPVKGQTSSRASDFLSQNEDMDDTQSIPFSLPDPPSPCQNRSAPSTAPITKQNVREPADHELARDEGYKDAADAARAAALSAERAAAAAIAVASLAKENFARMHSDVSKRSNSDSDLASDEDDYRKETTERRRSPESKPRDSYFGIRADSFDGHLMDAAETEAPAGDVSIAAKPLFDEYPEEEGRYTRAHKPAVEDYASDGFESDSTERSDSPPLCRRGRYGEDYATHKNYTQSMKENRFHQDDEHRADPRAKGFFNYDNRSRKEPQRSKADDRGFHHDYNNNNKHIKEPPRFDADEPNLEQKSRMQKLDDAAAYRINGVHESSQSIKSRGLSVQRGRGGGGYSGGPPERCPPTVPHVHPKLPNYDDLTARFEALRARR